MAIISYFPYDKMEQEWSSLESNLYEKWDEIEMFEVI